MDKHDEAAVKLLAELNAQLEYEDCVRIIAAALRAAEQPQWQPMETAPKDLMETKKAILTWNGSAVNRTTRGRTAHLSQPGWFNEQGWMIHPTHWMPLPAPAKEQP